jgi:apolipoprotein N-acyltransferase
MPGYDLPVLPFVSLAPLIFLSSTSDSPAHAARRAFAWGTLANLLIYYWIAWTVAVPGHLGWLLGAACALAVSAFVAGFLAAISALMHFSLRRLGPSALWAFPVFWVAVEMARIHLFTGFPWMLLGYSLAGNPLMRQAADIAGTVGLGFLVAFVNAAAFRFVERASGRRWASAVAAGAAGLVVVAVMAGYGEFRSRQFSKESGPPLRVGIAQGGIDQNRKWDPAHQEETVDIYRDLTIEAVAKNSRVVVWPETAAPFFYGWESGLSDRLDNVARAAGTPIVFGAPWFSPDDGGKYFNSVFLLGADGMPAGRYDKRHLVPFGEYVPLRRLLPFISKLTAGEEDFSYGKAPAIFRVAGSSVSASVCYEAVFPEIIRESVLAGADWLINVTNDAWFGDTVAPHQHLAMARMRVVETRRPMARAANSGISAIIRADGEIAASLGLFRKGVLVADIVPGKATTPFVKTGELLGYSCIIIGFLIFLLALKGNHGNRNSRGADNRP